MWTWTPWMHSHLAPMSPAHQTSQAARLRAMNDAWDARHLTAFNGMELPMQTYIMLVDNELGVKPMRQG